MKLNAVICLAIPWNASLLSSLESIFMGVYQVQEKKLNPRSIDEQKLKHTYWSQYVALQLKQKEKWLNNTSFTNKNYYNNNQDLLRHIAKHLYAFSYIILTITL